MVNKKVNNFTKSMHLIVDFKGGKIAFEGGIPQR